MGFYLVKDAYDENRLSIMRGEISPETIFCSIHIDDLYDATDESIYREARKLKAGGWIKAQFNFRLEERDGD